MKTILLLILVIGLSACAVSPFQNGPRRTAYRDSYSDRLEATNWCKAVIDNRLRSRAGASEEVLVIMRRDAQYRALTLDCLRQLEWL